MHLELVARAISGIISPCTSIDEFMVNSRIFGRSVARDVLQYLYIRRILSISNGIITFLPPDRLKLTWRDFEVLTIEVLKIFGYKMHLNVRFKKPRSFKVHVNIGKEVTFHQFRSMLKSS